MKGFGGFRVTPATEVDDWAEDVLLPTQVAPVCGVDPSRAEFRLALAVLEDAVFALRAAAGVSTPRARRLADEAWAWVASDDAMHPFAFVNVCHQLGLDPAWIRAGARRSYGPRQRPAATRRTLATVR